MHRTLRSLVNGRGFSAVEILIVTAISGVVAAIAIPMSTNAISYYRISGDARSVSNAIQLTKMRAAATFSHARLYVDLSGKTFRTDLWNKTTGTWVTEAGLVSLNPQNSFGYGVVGTAPPNAPSLAQAPACLDTASPPNPIANTACVVFNSRGVPIDASNNPTTSDSLYITNGSNVYGAVVSATGMIRLWHTQALATPTWTTQ